MQHRVKARYASSYFELPFICPRTTHKTPGLRRGSCAAFCQKRKNRQRRGKEEKAALPVYENS